MQHRILPHKHKNRFFNHQDELQEKVLLNSVLMYCKGWGMRNSGIQELHAWHHHTSPFSRVQEAEERPRLTWIGHATFLIQSPHYTIITDPVFDDLTLLFQRIQKPGLGLHDLPHIDAVLISHNHRDHMEKKTLQHLAKKFPACTFFVPDGDRRWLHSWGIERVVEASWWNEHTIPVVDGADAVRLIFLPAYHWSQRGLFDYNKSLWGSWMIEYGDVRIYFAGDTAYSKHFQAIACEFKGIDYALMPIGPCEPHLWMQRSHVNAEEAGQAFLDLGAQVFVPMHWGTFKFGTDRPLGPIERLEAWWHSQITANQASQSLLPIKIGMSVDMSKKIIV